MLPVLLLCMGAWAQGNPYGIYPVPHSTETVRQMASVSKTVSIIAEEGIDQYTIDRAVQILEEHGKIGILGGDEGEQGEGSILRLCVDGSLAAQGKYDRHNITIKRQAETGLAEIVIVGENTDATFYGLASLEQMLDKNADDIICGEIQDYADVKNRGIIEGY